MMGKNLIFQRVVIYFHRSHPATPPHIFTKAVNWIWPLSLAFALFLSLSLFIGVITHNCLSASSEWSTFIGLAIRKISFKTRIIAFMRFCIQTLCFVHKLFFSVLRRIWVCFWMCDDMAESFVSHDTGS